MDRLSALSAAFLSAEDVDPDSSMVIGSVGLLRGPAPTLDDVRELVEDRLPPRYRQRVRRSLLGLRAPGWLDEEDFDVSRHVRRVAVPAPGGREELAELLGRTMSKRMDRHGHRLARRAGGPCAVGGRAPHAGRGAAAAGPALPPAAQAQPGRTSATRLGGRSGLRDPAPRPPGRGAIARRGRRGGRARGPHHGRTDGPRPPALGHHALRGPGRWPLGAALPDPPRPGRRSLRHCTAARRVRHAGRRGACLGGGAQRARVPATPAHGHSHRRGAWCARTRQPRWFRFTAPL